VISTMPQESPFTAFALYSDLPSCSWKEYERVLEKISEGRGLSSKEKDLSKFLNALGFAHIETNLMVGQTTAITELGKAYFTKKFVQNDTPGSIQILRGRLIKLKPVIIVCSVLFGVPHIKKHNVIKALQIHGIASEEYDVGSFLSLLNYTDIIKYSKKAQTISIVYNPNIYDDTGKQSVKTYLINQEKPYTNLLALKRVIRECKGKLIWIERHFTKKIFELISEEADGNKISEILIMSGPINIDNRVLEEFKLLKVELKNKKINVSFCIVTDNKLFHGRWVIGNNICYKIPPTNTIIQGQADEIDQTEERPPFEKWKKDALDIEADWNQLQKYLKK